MARSSRWKIAGLVMLAAVALSAAACNAEKKREPAPNPLDPVATPSSTPPPSAAPVLLGNADHGKALVQKFECNRCHDGTGFEAAPLEKHCTSCHDQIALGKFRAPADKLAKWKKNVGHMREVPSLVSAGKRLRPEWVVAFLQEPRDLRPHMSPTMPRLAITPAQAGDIAAYLLRETSKPAQPALKGDAAQGRLLFEQKSCGTCHGFGGVAELGTRPDPELGSDRDRRAVRLAPDLRHARERLLPAQLVAWLLDPSGIKPGTLMPVSGLSPQDAAHLSAFILETPLAPARAPSIPARLPVLERKVGFEEVMDRVLGKTCRHCHSDPDVSLGDGGPGNTGGFGFAPRRLNVATYSGISAGLLDQRGERQSVFAKLADGTPRLVAAMLARYSELAGKPNPEVRGMPLGLPPIPIEDIQLVESWIAQGRPR